MVSWGRSFKAALLLLVFTLLWVIVGGVIIFIGMLLIPSEAFFFNPITGSFGINWGAIIGAVILWIIGYLIILLGVYASFFKVNTEIIVEEVRKQPPPP
ncbi:MAG: hypothetical protein QXP55_04770 [Nitrososphaerales archaeon]